MADRRRKKNKGEERKIDSEAYELLKSRLEKAPSPDEASAGVLSAEFAHFRGNVPVCSLIEDYLFFSPRKGENHLSAEQILGIFLQYDIVLDKATLSRWSEKPGFEYLLPRLFHEAYGEFGRSEKGGRKNSFTRKIFDDASFGTEYSGAFEWIARETVEKFPNAFFNSDSFRVYARWKGIKGTAEKIGLLEDMILRLRKMAEDQEKRGEVPFDWKREWNGAYKTIAEQAVSVVFESRYSSYESRAAMEEDAASIEEAVKKLDQALADTLKIKSIYDADLAMSSDPDLNEHTSLAGTMDIPKRLAEGGLSVPNLWRAFFRHYVVPAGKKILEAERENRGERLRNTAFQNDMRNKVFDFFLSVNAFLEESGLSPDDEPLPGEIVNALFNAAADKNSLLAGCIVHAAGGDGRGSLLKTVKKTYRERLDRVMEDFLVPGDDIPFSFFEITLREYEYRIVDSSNFTPPFPWKMTWQQIEQFILDTTERAVRELETGKKSEFALSCVSRAFRKDERPDVRPEKYLELLARFGEEWRVVPHIADIAGLAVKHLESARQMGAMLETVRNTPAAVRNMKESLIRTGSPRFGAPAGEITSILSILAGNPRKGEGGEWIISAQTDPDGTLNEFLRLDSSGTGTAELVREVVSLYASKKMLNGEFNRKQENMFSLLAADVFGDPNAFFERLKKTAEHITAVSENPEAIASVILLPWTEAFLKSGDEVYGKKPSPLSPDGVQWNGIFTAALNRLMNFGNTDEARIALSGILKKIEDVTGKGYTSVPNGVCIELLGRAAQFAPDDPSVLMDVIDAADQIIGALSWREGEAFSDEVKALYGCLNRTVGRLMNLDSSGAYTMECLLSLDGVPVAETAKKMCGDHIRDLVSKGVNPLSGGIEYWEKISRIKASVVIRYGDVLKKEVGEEGYGKAVADALRNINGGDAGKDLLGACLSPLAGVNRSSKDTWDDFISSADGQAARIAAGKFSRYSTADEFRRFLDSRDTGKLLNFLEVLDEGGVSRERTDILYKVLSKHRLIFLHKIFSGGLLRMDGENSRDVRVLTRMFTGKPPLESDSFEALSRAVRTGGGTVFGALKELLEEDPRTENVALHQELCRVCFRKVLEEEMPPEEKRASDDYISLMAGLLLEAARGEEGESDGKKRRGRGKTLVEPDFPDIL